MLYRVFIYGRKNPCDRYSFRSDDEQIDVLEMSDERTIREEARRALTDLGWWEEHNIDDLTATSASFEIIANSKGEKDEIIEVFPVHAWLYERFNAFVNG